MLLQHGILEIREGSSNLFQLTFFVCALQTLLLELLFEL